MSEPFKIQNDWPLPAINRAPKGVRRKYKLEDMVVGAMFFVPGRKVRSVSAYISRVSKPLQGKKFTARRAWGAQRADGSWHEVQAAHSGAVEGVGVWRIE